MPKSELLRMDNMGIVVESLDEAVEFFTELGLTLEGRATVEGEWAGRVTGLGDQRVEVAMMVTPDGHSRLELSRFVDPPIAADHRTDPLGREGGRAHRTAPFVVAARGQSSSSSSSASSSSTEVTRATSPSDIRILVPSSRSTIGLRSR